MYIYYIYNSLLSLQHEPYQKRVEWLEERLKFLLKSCHTFFVDVKEELSIEVCFILTCLSLCYYRNASIKRPTSFKCSPQIDPPPP